MREQSKLLVEYRNLAKDILTVILVDHRIFFNHTDLHEENEWSNISELNKYVLAEDELKVIHGFRLYINMI